MKNRKESPGPFGEMLIAPCGIDCAACWAFLRPKNPCFGCLPEYEGRGTHVIECRIKACAKERGFLRCSECPDLPCARMKHIDARYRKSWSVGLVDELRKLRSQGMDAYLHSETERWTCNACGGRMSIHRRECPVCGAADPRFPACDSPLDDSSS
ncbi:MAG TPA: DUF3795 domain-containing protein [Candidatus Izemoplasmatales bacterium]|nr:DUF3795 domain-containing protein [Candidatus Izemoplasmatales bacterium]